ncbi:MAG: phosphatase PAP2 family protein [Hyphomicrobiales bacterium]
MHLTIAPGEAVLVAILVVGTFLLLREPAGPAFAAMAAAGAVGGLIQTGHTGFALSITVLAGAVALVWRRGIQPYRYSLEFLVSQFAIVLGALSLYVAARVIVEGSYGPAHANAMRILDFERALGSNHEGAIQDWLGPTSTATRLANTIYSFYFLPFVGCVLLWLLLFDRTAFRIMRNALGVSVVLTVIAITLFPVAPPRLVPEAGIIDTVVAVGRQHSFANEYAAVPSLHVGWMALAGYSLALTMRSRWRYPVAVVPGLAMLLVVIATGNHYWVDGVVGAAFSLVPAFAMSYGWLDAPALALGARTARRGALIAHAVVMGAVEVMTSSARAVFTSLSLGGLLLFLVMGELISPGFTNFWGYLFFQMAATLALLLAGEWIFREQGGLAWQTHLIAVATGYADTFGTAGDLYANIAEYDKLTHFFGVAAVTAGSYDCLRALHRRGHTSFWATNRVAVAVLIGVAVGAGWEVYEFFGDELFATKRVQGQLDTTYDLIFDTLGALAAAWLLRRAERAAREEEWLPEALGADGPPG